MFSGETIFDPIFGSKTTLKVARELGRKVGYEIDLELKDAIRKKLGLDYHRWTGEDYLLEEKTEQGISGKPSRQRSANKRASQAEEPNNLPIPWTTSTRELTQQFRSGV